MKKYNYWRSLLSLSCVALLGVVLFRLLYPHWPSWHIFLFLAMFQFSGDALEFWLYKAAERKRLARKERLNQLGKGDNYDERLTRPIDEKAKL